MGFTRMRIQAAKTAAVMAVLVLAAATAAACGGEKVKPASSDGASAAPRSINGQVSYGGAALAGHKIVIAVNRVGSDGPPAYSGVLTKAGPYSIANVADGSYTLLAFIDMGDDMGSPLSNEPMGLYDGGDGTADTVVLAGGKAATGVDITIRDR